jgi:predicted flap endonuclease-1-like 5' DNA nuclease
MASLREVEGIGTEYYQKLKSAGVDTVKALLERGATPKGRQELADQTGISPKLILEWVNHADLFRIQGIGEEYSDLLEEAGVDTVTELAQRSPKNLYEKLLEINKQKNLVRRAPTSQEVENWVNQAKQLPRTINY